jgi:VWFA-related protein
VQRGIFLFVTFIAACVQAFAQANLRVETTLVVIPVTVTDASNRFVIGLEKHDFTISEDGKQQSIDQFADEEAPLSVGLLVDTSGSMGAKLDRSRQAVAEFLKSMNRSDEAFLVEFNDHAQLTVPFTSDPSKIVTRLGQAESQGLTALFDGVETGLREMKNAKNPRKALLIVSDGGDNNSHYTGDQITSLVHEADVQVYAMGVFEAMPMLALSAAEVSGPHLLSQLAEQTGGRAFPARTSAVLPDIARRIAIELRNEYVIAYRPTNHERNGKYRKVQVTVDCPKGLSALKPHWRVGYYAPSQ